MGITGRDIAPAICKALGIDIRGSKSIDVHIRVAANEVATVTVTRLIQDYETKQMAEVLERYELHAKEEQVIA